MSRSNKLCLDSRRTSTEEAKSNGRYDFKSFARKSGSWDGSLIPFSQFLTSHAHFGKGNRQLNRFPNVGPTLKKGQLRGGFLAYNRQQLYFWGPIAYPVRTQEPAVVISWRTNAVRNGPSDLVWCNGAWIIKRERLVRATDLEIIAISPSLEVKIVGVTSWNNT